MGRWCERRRFSGRTSRARRLGLLVISASLIGGTLAQILIPALGWLLSLSAALVVCSGAGKKSDKALVNWTCKGDTYKCQGTITWMNGTGKYTIISGSIPFTEVTEVSHADGKASGWAIWNR